MSTVSVAGISSGGYMAVQLGVAFSTLFEGVAVFAGGPFYCANNNILTATTSCMTSPDLISVSQLVGITANTALWGYIDPTSAMATQKIWLFSGTQDTIVVPGVVSKLAQYYGNYVKASNIKTVFNTPAEHSWVTSNYGSDCARLGSPFINNCQYDAEKDFLSMFYGTLKPAVAANSTNLMSFLQTAFLPAGYTGATAGINDIGYVYVPTACKSGIRCKLTVALHGCEMTLSDIGTSFVEHANLNEWAEANGIIVLYPQARSNTLNPKGCWDWWGYTGTNYASNTGAQMVTIHNMITHLAGASQGGRKVPLRGDKF